MNRRVFLKAVMVGAAAAATPVLAATVPLKADMEAVAIGFQGRFLPGGKFYTGQVVTHNGSTYVVTRHTLDATDLDLWELSE